MIDVATLEETLAVVTDVVNNPHEHRSRRWNQAYWRRDSPKRDFRTFCFGGFVIENDPDVVWSSQPLPTSDAEGRRYYAKVVTRAGEEVLAMNWVRGRLGLTEAQCMELTWPNIYTLAELRAVVERLCRFGALENAR